MRTGGKPFHFLLLDRPRPDDSTPTHHQEFQNRITQHKVTSTSSPSSTAMENFVRVRMDARAVVCYMKFGLDERMYLK